MDTRQDNKLTINKVAELCGVSKTTVSRFLNGKYDNMSPETRARIAEVITALDYHPNRSAQRLKAQRAMLIGCVLADVSSPFSAIVLKGIASYCEQAGYHVLFADSGEDAERERKAIQGFLENGVDGLLINATNGNEALLRELNEKLPVVLVDRRLGTDEFDVVCSPNFETAFDTTKLLYDMGYGSVVFVSEAVASIMPRVERRAGYTAAVESVGGTAQYLTLDPVDDDFNRRCLGALIGEHKGERLSLFCVNGVAAMRSLVALSSLDVSLGDQLGFITFDDWSWLQISKTGISTIQLGTADKGEEAARLLIQRIVKSADIGPEAQRILVPSRVMLRGSTVRA